MSADTEVLDFARELAAEVLERSQGSDELLSGGLAPGDFKENVFTRLIIDHLTEAGVLEDGQVCFFTGRLGAAKFKVNGYAVNDDEDALDLFVTLYAPQDPPAPVSPDEVRQAMDRAVRLFSEIDEELVNSLERSSEAHGMASRMLEVRDQITRLRVFALTDGVTSLKSQPQVTRDGVRIQFQIWDIERLFRNLAAGRPHEAIEIDLEEMLGQSLPCLPLPVIEEDYHAYLIIVPAELLYRMYEEYGPRLLELNVRSFLQARGKVNRGIAATIRDEPGHFFPYNNGLSMTAAEVRTKPGQGARLGITYIRGLQIVNGGQTTASIHRARKEGADLSAVYVQAKVTVLDSEKLEEMVPKISRYANSQNVVNEADFSANHPYHIAIERLASTTWIPGEQGRWFYERARGQYQVAKAKASRTPAQKKLFERQTPGSRRFAKTDLAKFVNTWNELPHIVSRGGQKNFVAFMDRLNQEGAALPDVQHYKELVAKAILFRDAQRIIANEDFQGYRANIVAYSLAYLIHRMNAQLDLARIWDNQAISEATERTIRRWSQDVNRAILESAGTKNVTEWCKREECWSAVLALNLALPGELHREAASSLRSGGDVGEGANGDAVPSRKDFDNIALCRSLDAATWMDIHTWGVKTDKLTYLQKGITLTLSSYAANGWAKQPSVKQARHAAEALKIARREMPGLKGR